MHYGVGKLKFPSKSSKNRRYWNWKKYGKVHVTDMNADKSNPDESTTMVACYHAQFSHNINFKCTSVYKQFWTCETSYIRSQIAKVTCKHCQNYLHKHYSKFFV